MAEPFAPCSMPKPTFFNLPAAKRERIVALAIDEFSGRSFREASLSRIVARAGIAKGSMYQYFDNKLDLYRWLITEELARRKAEFLGARAPSPDADFFARIRAMIRAGIEFFLVEPRLSRIAAALLDGSSDPGLREIHAEIRGMGTAVFVEFLRQARERGEIRADLDLEVLARLVSVVLGVGLSDVTLSRLGVDMGGFLADPSLASRLTDEDISGLIEEVIAFVRGGLLGVGGVVR